MNPLLTNTADVSRRFFDETASWLAVRDDNADPFLLFVNTDGEIAYAGIPMAMDEDGAEVDDNRGLLTDELTNSGPAFPLVEMGSH